VNRLARARLGERDFCGVQEIASRDGKRCAADVQLACGAVERVSTTGCRSAEKCTRIWCVRPVCSWTSSSVVESTRASTCQSVRPRAPCAGERRARGHARAAIRITRNGELNAAALLFQRHPAPAQRRSSGWSARGRLPQAWRAQIIFRHQENAGSFLVQAMDDAGRRRSPDCERDCPRPSNALTSVPWEFPAPACTIMPAALLMAMTSSSS